jgi:hypothetical protein
MTPEENYSLDKGEAPAFYYLEIITFDENGDKRIEGWVMRDNKIFKNPRYEKPFEHVSYTQEIKIREQGIMTIALCGSYSAN